MTIEVPAEEINSQVDDIYKELSAHAQLPGFRPGKAPMNLLKLRFGKKVIEEAREKAVEEACKKVLEDSNLKVIGEPRITPRDKKESEESQEAAGTEEIDEKQDKALTFDLEVEHIPEFEPADYDSLEVEIPDWSIKEETVQEVLENFQQRMAMIIPAGEDKVIEDGDIVGLSVEATCGGEPFPEATHDDYAIELGAREHLPGFEDALRGLKVGDETEIKIIMPDDYQLEKYKGQEAVFQVKVNQISTRQLPQIDDEFAKDVSEFDTLDELKEDTKKMLEKKAKDSEMIERQNSAVSAFVEASQVEVPDVLIEKEIDYQIKNFEQQMSMQGIDMKDYYKMIGANMDGLRESIKPQALTSAKTELVIDKFIKEKEFEITDEEIETELENLAKSYKIVDEGKLNEFKENLKKQSLQYITDNVSRKKAIEFITDNVKFVEKNEEIAPEEKGQEDK